ncbi:enoyl-CoA hydratase-related protein [Pseudomonas aeruginosa]|nr:enoyl-CoA hydratase-related protein [Pseudomonas aeruginosa]
MIGLRQLDRAPQPRRRYYLRPQVDRPGPEVRLRRRRPEHAFADGDKAQFARNGRRLAKPSRRCAFHEVSIAAISWLRHGGGLECALACDIRIAERQAQMALPRPRWACCPAPAGPRRCPGCGRRLGQADDPLQRAGGCGTALRIGLVEQVVDSGEARGAALLLAAKVARQEPGGDPHHRR